MTSPLLKDVQAFPLVNGRVNLTSASDDSNDLHASIIFCVVDGTIDVTFKGESSAVTIQMYEGWAFTLRLADTIDISGSDGTFHISL